MNWKELSLCQVDSHSIDRLFVTNNQAAHDMSHYWVLTSSLWPSLFLSSVSDASIDCVWLTRRPWSLARASQRSVSSWRSLVSPVTWSDFSLSWVSRDDARLARSRKTRTSSSSNFFSPCRNRTGDVHIGFLFVYMYVSSICLYANTLTTLPLSLVW